MSPHAPFWMVYGAGKGAPTARHKTRESAVAEASRLARNNPSVAFWVLEATHHIIKRDVDVTMIDPDLAGVGANFDDGVPF